MNERSSFFIKLGPDILEVQSGLSVELPAIVHMNFRVTLEHDSSEEIYEYQINQQNKRKEKNCSWKNISTRIRLKIIFSIAIIVHISVTLIVNIIAFT